MRETLMLGKEVPCPYCAQLIAREAAICSQCQGALRLGSFGAMRMAVRQDPSLALRTHESLSALQSRVYVLDRMLARQQTLFETVRPVAASLDSWGTKLWKSVVPAMDALTGPTQIFFTHVRSREPLSRKLANTLAGNWEDLAKSLGKLTPSPDREFTSKELLSARQGLNGIASQVQRSRGAYESWAAYCEVQAHLMLGLNPWLDTPYGAFSTGKEALHYVDVNGGGTALPSVMQESEYWLGQAALQTTSPEISTAAIALIIQRFMVTDGRAHDAAVLLEGVSRGGFAGRFGMLTSEGAVRYALGDVVGSSEVFRRALASAEEPRDEALNYLARIAEDGGDTTQAMELRSRLVIETPNSRHARTAIAAQRVKPIEPSPQHVASADWFPDPHGIGRLRYWDGNTWTEHTAD